MSTEIKRDMAYSELTEQMSVKPIKREQSRADLEYNYNYDGLYAQVVDRVVDSALEESFTITEDNEENQAILASLDIKHVLPKALKESRLYGGSVILVHQNVESLEQAQLPWINGTEITELTVVCRFDIQTNFDETTNEILSYTHNNVTYHPSRAIHLNAFDINDKHSRSYNGFSPSITERSYEALIKRDSLTRGTSKLADRMGLLFYKGEGFAEQLKQDSGGFVSGRMRLLSDNMSSTKITALDAKEDVFRLPIDFGGLDNMMESANKQVSAMCGIPYSVLFSPDSVDTKSAGQYRKMVQLYRNNVIAPVILRLLNMTGLVSPTLRVLFNSVTSEDMIQNSLNMVNSSNALCALFDRGLISKKEVRSSLASESNYSTLVLDTETTPKELTEEEEKEPMAQHGTSSVDK